MELCGMEPDRRKRRDENTNFAAGVLAAVRAPVPFRGSAKVERFPRTIEKFVLREVWFISRVDWMKGTRREGHGLVRH